MKRLEEKFKSDIVKQLRKEFNHKNDLSVPRLKKVIVNVGIGSNAKDDKYKQAVQNTLIRITGQKPIINLAKKSISAFKVRKGMPVGMSVTLRGKRMYDFIDKLINIALPRVRDFRGLAEKSLDGNGNMNIGIKEHIVFPEIKPDEVEIIHGLEIAIVTDAKTDSEAKKLFELLGFPFTKD